MRVTAGMDAEEEEGRHADTDGDDGGEDAPPVVLCAQIAHCELPQWYARFRGVTVPCTLVPLPPSFLSYLARRVRRVCIRACVRAAARG